MQPASQTPNPHRATPRARFFRVGRFLLCLALWETPDECSPSLLVEESKLDALQQRQQINNQTWPIIAYAQCSTAAPPLTLHSLRKFSRRNDDRTVPPEERNPPLSLLLG